MPDDVQPALLADSEELEPSDREELADPDPQPEPVTYTGTDFDVEGLVRRLKRGDIVIPTFGETGASIETDRFQRRFVWGRSQMSRFIESLLLGYPIPGIFLVQQADRRYLVLDGQQRMRTLADFYSGTHKGKPFALEDVADDLRGLTYEGLSLEQRRTLDNTFIPAIIVKTDGSPESLDAVYQVFERLNSGGTQLTPHEIRVALYAGPIMEFLAELNDCETWRSLYGPESRRLRDQELVLRIIALHVSPGTYRRPLKRYLNDFAAQHRFLTDLPVDRLRNQFSSVAEVIQNGPGPDALRYGSRQVNAALTEAIFVGMMRRLEAASPPNPSLISDVIGSMHEQPGFDLAISRATADEESVRTRLFVATQAFAGI
ncbi:MAG TPA: DUF262 domain-containing protein [Solirubrobacterales bacterium]|nr:DUF262 domain-containing protein [Solirubrobacterales bacterium]